MEKMIHNSPYDTVSETINWLREIGYTQDFNLCDGLKSQQLALSPLEFHIDCTFRFEGSTDPADEDIIYAISHLSKPIKGILMNAFGLYSDPMSHERINRL